MAARSGLSAAENAVVSDHIITIRKVDADAEHGNIDKRQNEVDTSPSNRSDGTVIDPTQWTLKYRWFIVGLCSLIEMLTNCAVLICAPAIPQILRELGSTNYSEEQTLVITIWNLGGILGMFVIGPLSELYGRRPIYNIFNIVFCLCALVSGFSRNTSMLLAFRFLNGIGIASQALNLSIIGDMFEAEKRGKAQAWVAVGPLLGAAMGPVIGGYLAQTVGWRWTFWLIAIIVAILGLLFFLFYRETYLPRLKCHQKGEKGSARLEQKLASAVVRPVRIFVMPVFLIPASCLSLVYGYFYIVVTTTSETFQETYAFSAGASGLVYIGISIGMALGTFVSGATLDRYVAYMKARHDGATKAEWRLPLVLVGGVLVAVGLFLYGWTIQYRVQFMAPIIGTSIIGFSLSATAIPIITYFTDVFGDFRASAMSTMTAYRQLVGILLPLAGPTLFRRMGYGWGSSILGFIALAMVPVPFLFIKYGERMRSASSFPVRLH